MRRSLAGLACAAVCAVAMPSSAHAASDGDCRPEARRALDSFVGVVSEDVFSTRSQRYARCTLSRQVRSGIAILRQPFRWSEIEVQRGVYVWGRYDAFVGALAARRIRLLPILFAPPRFRSAEPETNARRGTYPPRRFRDMGNFGKRLVRRYGPEGSFWREHPELPFVPIRSWQVWNEPNLPAYWPEGPDAHEYARLLLETARGIRFADPDAEIVTAGLPDSRLGIPLYRYVRDLYAAGAARAFDTLAINPYAPDAAGSLAIVAGIRDLMKRAGDREARIWITEIGWSTQGPPSPFTLDAPRQAQQIRALLAGARSRRRQLGLAGVIYYAWRDARPHEGGRDFWGLHTGLLDRRNRAKPGLSAFARAASPRS